MEYVQAWGDGSPIELGDIVLIEYEDDGNPYPVRIVTKEFVHLTFDMMMPFVIHCNYVIRIDNLVWGVQCLQETMCNNGKTIHYKYKFRRLNNAKDMG